MQSDQIDQKDPVINKSPLHNMDNQHTNSSQPSKMNKLIVGVGLILVLALSALGTYLVVHSNKKTSSSGNSTTTKNIVDAQVNITSHGFIPASISIKVNQAVTWTNTDNAPHLVASDPYPTDNGLAGFNSKQKLILHDNYSFIFDKAGIYNYHDDLNPYTIKGTVIVH